MHTYIYIYIYVYSIYTYIYTYEYVTIDIKGAYESLWNMYPHVRLHICRTYSQMFKFQSSFGSPRSITALCPLLSILLVSFPRNGWSSPCASKVVARWYSWAATWPSKNVQTSCIVVAIKAFLLVASIGLSMPNALINQWLWHPWGLHWWVAFLQY